MTTESACCVLRAAWLPAAPRNERAKWMNEATMRQRLRSIGLSSSHDGNEIISSVRLTKAHLTHSVGIKLTDKVKKNGRIKLNIITMVDYTAA